MKVKYFRSKYIVAFLIYMKSSTASLITFHKYFRLESGHNSEAVLEAVCDLQTHHVPSFVQEVNLAIEAMLEAGVGVLECYIESK